MLSFLTPKIGAALALALVASSGFAWLQTERLAAANIKVTSLTTEADMLAQLAKSYKSTADAKDGVIKQQTEGLDAILKSRWQDRQAYTANLSAADGRAKSLTAQADKLIALKVPQGDEVDQCRSAREIGRAQV